jgi:hypothetical protein
MAGMILTGLVALLWTVAGYRYRPMREADGDLPDALPDLAGGGEPTVRTTSPEPDHARTPARS